jgi:hypothetical protein
MSDRARAVDPGALGHRCGEIGRGRDCGPRPRHLSVCLVVFEAATLMTAVAVGGMLRRSTPSRGPRRLALFPTCRIVSSRAPVAFHGRGQSRPSPDPASLTEAMRAIDQAWTAQGQPRLFFSFAANSILARQKARCLGDTVRGRIAAADGVRRTLMLVDVARFRRGSSIRLMRWCRRMSQSPEPSRPTAAS